MFRGFRVISWIEILLLMKDDPLNQHEIARNEPVQSELTIVAPGDPKLVLDR